MGCENDSREAQCGMKMRDGLVRFSAVLTVEEDGILIELADALKCSRAAAMRMLMETGSKHLKIEG